MAHARAALTCSRCQCDEIRVSHRRWYELPLTLIGLLPFRCLACQRRFFRRSRVGRTA